MDLDKSKGKQITLMLDEKTDKPLAVIDLDTVMPGTFVLISGIVSVLVVVRQRKMKEI